MCLGRATRVPEISSVTYRLARAADNVSHRTVPSIRSKSKHELFETLYPHDYRDKLHSPFPCRGSVLLGFVSQNYIFPSSSIWIGGGSISPARWRWRRSNWCIAR